MSMYEQPPFVVWGYIEIDETNGADVGFFQCDNHDHAMRCVERQFSNQFTRKLAKRQVGPVEIVKD